MRFYERPCRTAAIRTCEIRDDGGTRLSVCYRLIKTVDPSRHVPPEHAVAYSLFVSVSDGVRQAEQRFVYDFTRDASVADRVFNAVYRGRVTPAALCDVVQDLIG